MAAAQVPRPGSELPGSGEGVAERARLPPPSRAGSHRSEQPREELGSWALRLPPGTEPPAPGSAPQSQLPLQAGIPRAGGHGWVGTAGWACSCSPLRPQASPREAVDLRLREAQRFKEEGNRCYKEGCFRDAVRRYHRALLQLRGLDPSVPCPLQAFGSQAPRATPEQEQALQATQADCYNNLAGEIALSIPPSAPDRGWPLPASWDARQSSADAPARRLPHNAIAPCILQPVSSAWSP